MSIIKLNSVFAWEQFEAVVVILLIPSDNIVNRSRAEEVLLLESELLARISIIIWIQDTCDVLCVLSFGDGTVIVR